MLEQGSFDRFSGVCLHLFKIQGVDLFCYIFLYLIEVHIIFFSNFMHDIGFVNHQISMRINLFKNVL